MSAIGNIAIQDGQASPATHTFYPITSGERALWRESQTGLALIGQGSISTLTKLNPTVRRVRVELALPALETATGANAAGYTAAPKVAYTDRFVGEFFIPIRATEAQAKDLRVLVSNLILNSQIVDLIDKGQGPY